MTGPAGRWAARAGQTEAMSEQTSTPDNRPADHTVDVLVIGAGLSCVGAAYRLQT